MDTKTFLENFGTIATAPGGIDRIRQMALDLAVLGMCVRQYENDGSGDDLIRQSALMMGHSVSDSRSANANLPAKWGISDLKTLCVTQTGATPSKIDEEATGGSRIAYVKPGQIGFLSVTPSKTIRDGTSVSRKAEAGSVLFVGIGSIGKVGVTPCRVAFNQQIHSATPVLASPHFLAIVMASSLFIAEVVKRTSATTISIINKSKWETIPIPVPPLAEQKRIVAKVDELMALCDELEMQLQYQQDLSSRLAIASTRLSGRRFAIQGQFPPEFPPASTKPTR